MGRIYQRTPGGPFYAYFSEPGGKPRWKSLRTKDRKVAKERLRSAELAASAPQAKGKAQRLSEAITYMLTATLHDKADGTKQMYEQKGRRLIATMGDPDVKDIDRDMISGYIADRLSKSGPRADDHGHANPHTVKKELITLRKTLQESADRKILPEMPAFPKFSAKYKPRERWLTPQQFENLVSHLPRERELWCALAALAGGNLSEVEGIVWDDVDLHAGWTAEGEEKGWIRIRGTKRETRDRRVPIAPALRARLERVPEAERRGRVAGRWKNVRHELERACKKAKVPRVSPNDLRRTFASWLAQQGVDALTIAKLMGHSSTRMVEKVYARLADKNYDDAIAALPGGQLRELGAGASDAREAVAIAALVAVMRLCLVLAAADWMRVGGYNDPAAS